MVGGDAARDMILEILSRGDAGRKGNEASTALLAGIESERTRCRLLQGRLDEMRKQHATEKATLREMADAEKLASKNAESAHSRCKQMLDSANARISSLTGSLTAEVGEMHKRLHWLADKGQGERGGGEAKAADGGNVSSSLEVEVLMAEVEMWKLRSEDFERQAAASKVEADAMARREEAERKDRAERGAMLLGALDDIDTLTMHSDDLAKQIELLKEELARERAVSGARVCVCGGAEAAAAAAAEREALAAAARNEVGQGQEAMSKLQDKIRQLEVQLADEIRGAAEKLSAERDRADAERKTVERTMQEAATVAAQEASERLKAAVKEGKRATEAEASRADEAFLARSALESKVAELNKQVAGLTELLADTDRYKALQDEVDSMEAQVQAERSKRLGLEAERDAAVSRLREVEAESMRYKDDLESASAARERLSKLVNSLEKEKNAMDQERAAIENAARSTAEELWEVQRSHAETLNERSGAAAALAQVLEELQEISAVQGGVDNGGDDHGRAAGDGEIGDKAIAEVGRVRDLVISLLERSSRAAEVKGEEAEEAVMEHEPCEGDGGRDGLANWLTHEIVHLLLAGKGLEADPDDENEREGAEDMDAALRAAAVTQADAEERLGFLLSMDLDERIGAIRYMDPLDIVEGLLHLQTREKRAMAIKNLTRQLPIWHKSPIFASLGPTDRFSVLRDASSEEASALIRKLEGEDSVLALSGMGPARGSRVAALMTKHWLEMALVYLGARNLADVLATLDAADELRIMSKLPPKMRREVDAIAVSQGRGKRWMSGQSSRDRSSASSRNSSPPRSERESLSVPKGSGDDFGMGFKRSANSSAANSPPHIADRERKAAAAAAAADAARKAKLAAETESSRVWRGPKLTTDVLY